MFITISVDHAVPEGKHCSVYNRRYRAYDHCAHLYGFGEGTLCNLFKYHTITKDGKIYLKCQECLEACGEVGK